MNSALVEQGKDLRAQGLSYAEAARRLGVSYSLLYRALNRERVAGYNRNAADRKRAWENDMRATCRRCKGPMGAGTVRAGGTRRKVSGDVCADCRTAVRVERLLQMCVLRAEGATNLEIADRLEVSIKTVGGELYRMRSLGYRIPVSSDARCRFEAKLATPSANAAYIGKALNERGITPTSDLSEALGILLRESVTGDAKSAARPYSSPARQGRSGEERLVKERSGC